MTLIIYYILVLIVILRQSRMLEKRWKKVMGMEVKLKTSMRSLRQISSDSQVKDMYVRILARRLYIWKVSLLIITIVTLLTPIGAPFISMEFMAP